MKKIKNFVKAYRMLVKLKKSYAKHPNRRTRSKMRKAQIGLGAAARALNLVSIKK